jgi:uncharacterized membrane protein YwaF
MQFFFHEEQISPDAGFGMFSPVHIIWIAFIMLLCIAGCVAAGWMERARRMRFYMALAVAAFIFGFLEYGITALTGYFTRYTLPLHLCSLAYIICPVHAMVSGGSATGVKRYLDQIIFYPCLPGVMLAVLFPDWSIYPAFNYITVTGFLGHGLLMVYIISHLFCKDLDIRCRYTWMNISFIAAYSLFTTIINRMLGTDYFFTLGPSRNSPLLSVYYAWGYPGYIIVYALLGILVLYAAYGIYSLATNQSSLL